MTFGSWPWVFGGLVAGTVPSGAVLFVPGFGFSVGAVAVPPAFPFGGPFFGFPFFPAFPFSMFPFFI